MNYVRILSEQASADNDWQRIYTVGFYDPTGKWVSHSDHTDPDVADHVINYLNGGGEKAELVAALRDALAFVELWTRNGVRNQPSKAVQLPNGSFDHELIAKNARRALRGTRQDEPDRVVVSAKLLSDAASTLGAAIDGTFGGEDDEYAAAARWRNMQARLERAAKGGAK